MKGNSRAILCLLLTTLLCVLPACQATQPTPSPTPSGSSATAPVPSEAPSTPGDNSQYGGVLKICDVKDVTVLGWPSTLTAGSALRFAAPAIETLIRLDENSKPVGFLAESFKEDADALTVSFVLRQGIQFHDGTPLNADACKWNLDMMVANATLGSDVIDSVEVTGEYEFTIHLKEWDNSLTTNMAKTLGLVISPTAYETHGGDDGGSTWCIDNPVGTGPFRFVSWEKGVKIVYERNDNYWQEGLPYLDGIELYINGDALSREYSLRNGDYQALIRGATSNLVALAADGYTLNSTPSGTGPCGLIFDGKNPDSPFADVRVRQAVCYAVDVQAIVDEIFLGTSIVTNQFSYPGHWGYNEAVNDYSYNVETAKALLADAGYPNGFSTTLILDSNFGDYDLFGAAIQDMLSKVNINVELEVVDDPRYVQIYTSENWTGMLGLFGFAQPDSSVFLSYFVEEGYDYFRSMGMPDDLHSVIMDATSAKTEKEKIDLTLEAQRLMFDEYCLAFPMFISADLTCLSPNVHDSNLSQMSPATSWTPELIWIEK